MNGQLSSFRRKKIGAFNTVNNSDDHDDDFISICDDDSLIEDLSAKYKELIYAVKVNFSQKQNEDFVIQ